MSWSPLSTSSSYSRLVRILEMSTSQINFDLESKHVLIHRINLALSRTLLLHEVSFQLTSFRIHSDEINPGKITIRISDENFTGPQICGGLLAHMII
jgi:hypothetical protein